jgi:hypothetical protein
MEMIAAIQALEALEKACKVELHADSRRDRLAHSQSRCVAGATRPDDRMRVALEAAKCEPLRIDDALA